MVSTARYGEHVVEPERAICTSAVVAFVPVALHEPELGGVAATLAARIGAPAATGAVAA